MRTFNTILACFIVSCIHINFVFSNAPVIDENGCEITTPIIENNTIPNTLFYPSGNKEGLIGTTKDKPVDNPADNVFHVALDEIPDNCQQIWLEYELYGVQDHTAVSRSINDQLSAGGYLVQTNEKWTTQRELIRIDWLKQGNNVIRFAVPKGASYSYRVRNLGLRVTEIESEQAPDFIIQNNEGIYYENKAYVKGFVDIKDESSVSVCVDGEEVVVADGEFEILVNKPETQRKWWFQKQEKKWSVEVEVAYPSGEVKYETVRFNQDEKADYSRNLNKKINYTEKLFSIKTAQQIQLQSAVLNVPADALESEELISITALRTVDIPALNPGMVNVTAYDDAYRMLPHGTQFKVPVELTLKYDKSKIPSGYTEADIRTFYFDEITHNWVPIPRDSVDAATGRIFSRTTHFTDYINGIIQVPESPETNAYTPTSIKDIKAANPSAAINEIQPPSANNMGTANLSYPINIPAGRQGMQPSVGIQYNSGGGNGWLGLGWDLSVPAITIETRWGVPRFGEMETETYSMMGQQLWPVAHRDTPVARTGPTKQFYPRVEGAFNRIIRHGTDPTNYHWEVTDKSGTTYFYGGVDAVDPAAVLKDAAGNIGHWALVEMRDLNDNFVRYNHAIQNDVGIVGGSVMGQNLYCESITYTGHGNTEGRYSVVFTRDRELGETKRRDVQINGRLAFKRVTADLLRKIEVQLDDVNIRSYELHYREGELIKTLLDSITEYDAMGVKFVGHKFDYYDDVRDGNGDFKPLTSTQTWTSEVDGITAGFGRSSGTFNDDIHALGGSRSFGAGGGLAVTAGPFSEDSDSTTLHSKSKTAGASFAFSLSNSRGKLVLMDIDGDRLPDKVYRKSGDLYYRPNLSGPDGTNQFGVQKSISGINHFRKGRSNTINIGIESHFGVFAGLQYSRTANKNITYVVDANNDGLMDVVDKKKVKFCYLDENGTPTFTSDSELTPSPIYSVATVDYSAFEIDEEETKKEIRQNPLHDVVRTWIAPHTGTVNITGDIQLGINEDDEERVDYPADGVYVAIQLNSIEQWRTEIAGNDSTSISPSNVSNLAVTKGDRIYFRVQSVYDGAYDQVSWQPTVTYQTVDQVPVTQQDDANGLPIYEFNASDDFLLSGMMSVGMPLAGTISIEGDFKKDVTSDTVVVQVLKENTNGVFSVIGEKEFLPSDTAPASIPINANIPVVVGDNIYFQVSSSTNVDWASMEWMPRVFYTSATDPNIPVTDPVDGNYVIEFFPAVEYKAFGLSVSPSILWEATATETVSVTPQMTLNQNMEDGFITFSVKKNDLIFDEQIIEVEGGIPQASFQVISDIDVVEGDKLFVEYHVSNPIIAENIEITGNALVKGQLINAGIHTVWDSSPFGPMYRHWGQFAYKNNIDTTLTSAIDESKLDIDTSLSEPNEINLDGVAGEDMEQAFLDGEGKFLYDHDFIYMIPDMEKMSWRGYDALTYVTKDTISSSRLGLDEILSFTSSGEPMPPAGIADIPNKIMRITGWAKY